MWFSRVVIAVVMGVSGSGKSTVGHLLAERLGCDFAEGDDFHPPANVVKMAGGTPLDHDDRWPWLESIAAWIDVHVDDGRDGVVTCSSLKKSYRDVLRRDAVTFVYLRGSHALLAERMAGRTGHFMPASLLDSQLATLEEPSADGRAITIDIGPAPEVLVEEIVGQLPAR